VKRVAVRVVVVLVWLVMAGSGLAGLGFAAAAAPAAPTVTLESDHWHVDATLAGSTTFVFVVKTAGQADAYFSDVTSPFLIDPWRYGGLTVRVSARASGPSTNAWASEIQFDVRVPAPVLNVASDGWHVGATLPNTASFVFVVKTAGHP